MGPGVHIAPRYSSSLALNQSLTVQSWEQEAMTSVLVLEKETQ